MFSINFSSLFSHFIAVNDHYRRFFHSMFYPQDNVDGSSVTLHEAILLAWPFVIVGAVSNAVSSIYLTVNFFNQSTLVAFPFLAQGSLLTLPVVLGLFWSIWAVLLFPIRAYVFALTMMVVIGFYQRVSKKYAKDPTLAFDLVAASMSSNVFRMLPAFGDFLQSIAQFLCLYKGIKKRMEISSLATCCILFTPAVISILLMIGFIYSLILKNSR